MFKFFILTFTLLSFEAKSAEDLRELQKGRQFLARKLSNETVQKADEIRFEGFRVIKKLQSFNPLKTMPELGFLGHRIQHLLRSDPTLEAIITIFKKPIQHSDDLISIINITKVRSEAGVIIGGETQTDYDLILSYVRDATTELFPLSARKIFAENPGENASTLVQYLDIDIQRLQTSLPKAPGKKKAAKAAFGAAERKIAEDSLLSIEKIAAPKNEEEGGTAVRIQNELVATKIIAAKSSSSSSGVIPEISPELTSSGVTPEIRSSAENPSEIHEEATASFSEAASAAAASTAEKSTMPYDQLIRNTQSSFFQSWISRQDIKKIDDVFDLEAGPVDSLTVSNLLKNLVRKQRDTAYKAEFREGNGSHKLAILVSEAGKRILFPFAHHAGDELDPHSRDMIIDGFRQLFGIS